MCSSPYTRARLRESLNDPHGPSDCARDAANAAVRQMQADTDYLDLTLRVLIVVLLALCVSLPLFTATWPIVRPAPLSTPAGTCR